MGVHALVLAAGKGTRMKTETAKVLHRAAGRPLIDWCLDAVSSADDVVVVVGHQAAAVVAALPETVRSVIQEPQLGTGHATEVGLSAMSLDDGDHVLVTPGDMPLITRETIEHLMATHIESAAAATVLTAVVADLSGYGRIVRDDDGAVRAIVEHGDASPQEREIAEINTSVYVFKVDGLAEALALIGTGNFQGERYLTDVVGVLASRGEHVGAVMVDAAEAAGVNSHSELAAADAVLRCRMQPTLAGGRFSQGQIPGYAARRQQKDNREPT